MTCNGWLSVGVVLGILIAMIFWILIEGGWTNTRAHLRYNRKHARLKAIYMNAGFESHNAEKMATDALNARARELLNEQTYGQ